MEVACAHQRVAPPFLLLLLGADTVAAAPPVCAADEVWVTDGGQIKEKVRVADPAPGAVRFAGEVQMRVDATLLDRTTLTPLPNGRVRQVIEVSKDRGATWQVGFDGIYMRRPPAARPE